MTETRHNPTCRCPQCGQHWRSRPISVVVAPDLLLLPCPSCQAPLELANLLSSLTEETQYDDKIATQISQDQGAAYRSAFMEELKDWDIPRALTDTGQPGPSNGEPAGSTTTGPPEGRETPSDPGPRGQNTQSTNPHTDDQPHQQDGVTPCS